VKCSQLSAMCRKILKSQLGFPHPLDSAETRSSRQPKIWFAGNSAYWFGSSVATDPAQLQIINYSSTFVDAKFGLKNVSELRFIPGQDKLSLNAWIKDDLSQIVKGLDYTCRILICPSESNNCIEDASLLAAAYSSMDHDSGLFRAADIPLLCPTDEVVLMVQISLVAQASVSAWFHVICMPCRAGQARTLAASGRAWWCSSCSPKQYVINPNHPSFGCKVHHLNSVFVAIVTACS
jgi:hypothetical protein